MRNLLEAIWWWIRLTVLLIVAIYVISILALNARETPSLWYWYGRDPSPVSIVSIVLVSFLSGGVVFTTGWAMFKAGLRYRRTRSARRERLEQERRAEIERKARMLRTKPPPTPIVRRPPPVAPLPVEAEPEPAVEEETYATQEIEPVIEESPREFDDDDDEGPIPLTDERVAPATNDDAVAGVRLPPPSPPPAGS